ncbi:MAG: hypothetical protein MJ233_01140 [Mycoplasmoidaceae bacterium]|nr:hypothetical protein [Mycoplasmoidaceae bacterium]
MTHVESYFDGTPDKVGAGKLAAEIDTDIDAIISGHSHKKGCGTVYNSKLDKNI